MAILDAVDVSIYVPGLKNPLQECDMPVRIPNNVPWAANSKAMEKYVTGPEGKIFEIRIRLAPDFNFEGADGIHISLKIGDGRIVNHYYSIKFEEFAKDEKGGLVQTISSAITLKMNGFRRNLFSFGSTHSRSMSVPHGYYEQNEHFPEGKISLTLVKVNHCFTPLCLATTTNTFAAPEGACNTIVPVDVGKAVPPLVAEQVTLSEPVHRATFHFAFRYRTLPAVIFAIP